MRPLGRRGRQRRNLLCRVGPAECCRERRESLSKPFHNFSIGRHLWLGPRRSPLRRRAVQKQIGCSSDRSEAFACDFPQVDFVASDPTGCRLDAIAKSELESREVLENKEPLDEESEIRRKGLKSEESRTLDDCQCADSVSFKMEGDTRKRKNRCGQEALAAFWGHAGIRTRLFWNV